jgi:hypothetical protein
VIRPISMYRGDFQRTSAVNLALSHRPLPVSPLFGFVPEGAGSTTPNMARRFLLGLLLSIPLMVGGGALAVIGNNHAKINALHSAVKDTLGGIDTNKMKVALLDKNRFHYAASLRQDGVYHYLVIEHFKDYDKVSLEVHKPKASKHFVDSSLLNLPPSKLKGWAHAAQTRIEYQTSGGKDPSKIEFIFTTPTEQGPFGIGPGHTTHTVEVNDPKVIESVTGFIGKLQEKINAGLPPGLPDEFIYPRD